MGMGMGRKSKVFVVLEVGGPSDYSCGLSRCSFLIRCRFDTKDYEGTLNSRETAFAMRKLHLVKAKRYLEDVLAHKQAIPFRRFCFAVGRTAQSNLMDKYDGLSCQLNSSLICLRMPRVTLRCASKSFICFAICRVSAYFTCVEMWIL
ncbi:hypothetical protein RIF29_14652 [Crotalaria pallida]|uniref:Uncharacterized protein n=1 Tax=Crotalaria pallida TaxID=3830 RepID=A0AAN9IIH0_CROPI